MIDSSAARCHSRSQTRMFQIESSTLLSLSTLSNTPPSNPQLGAHCTGQHCGRWAASQERARNPEGSPETKKKASPGQAARGWMRSSQRCTSSPVRQQKPLQRQTGGFKSSCPIRPSSLICTNKATCISVTSLALSTVYGGQMRYPEHLSHLLKFIENQQEKLKTR